MLYFLKKHRKIRSISLYRVDFSGFLCYIFQNPKELEAMAQTTAEFLIEQGKAEGKAEGKQDAILKLRFRPC